MCQESKPLAELACQFRCVLRDELLWKGLVEGVASCCGKCWMSLHLRNVGEQREGTLP